MNAKTVLVIGMGLASHASLADFVDWTGASGASYTDAANWTVRGTDEHRVPLNTDVIVFAPGAGAELTVDCSGITEARSTGTTRFGTIRVESGTVKMTPKTVQFCGTQNSTNEIFVAEGAVLDMAFPIYPVLFYDYSAKTYVRRSWLRKTGGGTAKLATGCYWYDTSYKWMALFLDAGTLVEDCYSGNHPRFEQHVVADGALLQLKNNHAGDPFVAHEVAAGGRLETLASAGNLMCRGISGDGDIELSYYSTGTYTLAPNLNGGPYRFGGRVVQREAACNVGFKNYGANATYPASETERHFIIDGTNVFPNLASFCAALTPEFGRNRGEFYLPPIYAEPGAKFVLEDEDGEPIRLYADFCEVAGRGSGAATVVMEGAGDWFLRSGTTTVTGNQVRVTGTVGIPSGTTLNLGNGTDAAADMSTLPFAALENEGTLNARNVRSASFDGCLAGTGAFNFYSPLTIGSVAIRLTTTSFTVDGGEVEVKGGTLVSPEGSGRLAVNNSGTLKLSGPNTLFCGPDYKVDADYDFHSVKRRGFLLFQGGAGGQLEIADRARMLLGKYSCPMTDIRLTNGGTLCFLDGANWSNETSVATHEVYSDGGVLRLYGLENYNSYSFPSSSVADEWVAKVGPGGLKLHYDESVSARDTYGRLVWYDYLKTVPATAAGVPDGGLVIDAAGAFYLMRPQNVTGPFVLRDGRVSMKKSQMDSSGAGDCLCGAGDLVFDGGWLCFADNLTAEASVRLASGSGAKARIRSASRFDLDAFSSTDWAARSQKLELVFGPDDAATPSLVSENGAVLYVISMKGAVDGSNKTHLLVKGGVDQHVDGRTKAPIVMAAGAGDAQLATYDETLGLKKFTNYAADFASADSGKAVKVEATAVTVPAGGAQVGSLLLKTGSSTLVTIPSGATLSVGNGTDPAVVAVAPAYSSATVLFDGAGTLDFGTSRGVFASGLRSNYSYTREAAVKTKIAGTAGVTYSAAAGVNMTVNYYDNVNFCVTAANDYTGGTIVDMAAVRVTNPKAFADGPVDVRGGKMYGGAVCFGHAGPFANDFTINGYGRRLNDWDLLNQAGALEAFTPNVRITGDVTVASHSRIAAPQIADGSVAFVFEGRVSGERLEIDSGLASPNVSGMVNRRISVVFTQDNAALTGGVEVLKSTAILRGAKPTLGTGEILLDQGVLRFENTAALACTNAIAGIGTIQLAAEKEVAFSGDYSRLESVTLDLCGMRHEFTEIPPFANWTSGNGRAAIAIVGDGSVQWPAGTTLDNPKMFDLEIAPGAVLDLGGQTLTVRRALDGAAARITNGTLVETNPKRGLCVIVR